MINPYAGIDLETYERVVSVSHQHLSHASQQAAQDKYEDIYATGVRHFPVVQYRPSLMAPYDYAENTLQYTIKPIPAYTSIETIKSDYQAIVHIDDDVLCGANTEHVYPTLLINGKWDKWCSVHMNGMGSTFESYHMDDDGYWTNNNGLEIPYSEAISKILKNLVYPDGGGVIINHPYWTNNNKNGRNYDIQRFIMDCLDFDPRVLGTDILEDGQQTALEFNSAMIDAILSTGRRCWIFCMPDWASLDTQAKIYKNHGRNELLIPSGMSRQEKDYACMKAYRDGAFFSRYANSDLSITALSFDNYVFSITAENADGIDIITDGVTTTYAGTSAFQQVSPAAKYVRAVAYINRDDDPNWKYLETDVYKDIVFTNPIMVNETEYPYDPAYDVRKSKSAGRGMSLLMWG